MAKIKYTNDQKNVKNRQSYCVSTTEYVVYLV